MKRKINVCLILIIACDIVIFGFLLRYLINNLQSYFDAHNSATAEFLEILKRNIFEFAVLTFLSLLVAIVSIYALLFIINRADLSELLSSTKEKRLTKAEARRKQQIEELETQKEELEKKIDEMKKE